ncbi:MAG: TRAP transporter small permease subunit [Rhodobacteraceae bacterium]|nr:TRAP transporter small permease subunit [Paracoccaceae bacterium]
MIDRLGKPIAALAWFSALVGGLVLVAVMVMITVSVMGMSANKFGKMLKKSYDTVVEPLLSIGPIPGETEMVEVGMAFIIFAFLPIVTLNKGHAVVGILTGFFGKGVNRLIDVVSDGLMLVVAGFLAYRHLLGTLDKFGNGEATWILQFPVWWGYGAAMFGAAIFVIVAIYCLLRSVDAALRGRDVQVSGVVR